MATEIDGFAVQIDVADVRSVRAAFDLAEDAVGAVDVLVNNAGADRFDYFVDTDQAAWDLVLAVNLRGVLACTHAVLRSMYERRQGSIVNVSSEAGRVGAAAGATYSAAKAGVIGFTKAIARESAHYGVRCNAVAPGPIETPPAERRSSQPCAGHTLQAGDDRRHRSRPLRPARGGGCGDCLSRLRRRLLRHRTHARRERRPGDGLRVSGDDARAGPDGDDAGCVRARSCSRALRPAPAASSKSSTVRSTAPGCGRRCTEGPQPTGSSSVPMGPARSTSER